MRLPATATPGMDAHPNQQKRQSSSPEDTEEELYVGEDGLISVSPMDDKSRLDKLKLLLEHREQELRQAAEYGLGLLEANEELQMQVATLKIQLETETEELSVERDMWQRRSDHALQEVAQWKRKFARVEEEKTDLAEEFEQFVDRCECRAPDTTTADAATSIPASVTSSGRRYSHHLDTIAQLQTELQELQATERSNEAELTSLRQWKEVAEQQQQEALECEVLAAQSEVSYRKKMEEERAATQRAMNELKREKDQLRKAAHKHEEEMRALKKQLRIAEETRDDAQLHSNELSEEILSSESRCKRLQRELELLEHVSYFSQAIVDRDDEESDEDDEVVVEESNLETLVVSEKPEVKNIAANVDGSENDTETPAMPSPLRIKRRRSFLVATATPYSPFPTTTVSEDGTRVQASESEMETHKKLHHYFHLTALSIIHENNLLERCFNSSSRLTIDMWYREIIAKEVPFLTWHSWLINRISEVAASVQDDDEVPQPPTSTSKASSFSGAFHGFSMRKTSACSDATPPKNMLPSPPTVSSSPVSSPVARVPFTVARAFFRLLRKNTHAGSGSTSVGGSPVSGSPTG
ncbi:26S proteasome non-ATPase regulatory subunit 10 [Phytophthora cinnamomi]|uniref:26S proteasome non-ATPase regulatory subunit 10 n=1 Tax=Phytophthora cinnamomi TaxID=4785 RepID=UPI00355A7B38|nr:26S proteasome non-ATPase regulatory subunit 10 [Phytophthora cinnamomi]